jgi:hypothetical protein
MEVPTGEAPNLVVTNGRGRLFIQTLLPADAETRLCSGDDLYSYGGRRYPPSRDTGAAPKCRIEVSPSAPSETDTFLHVLTATDAETDAAPRASVADSPLETIVSVGPVRIALAKDRVAARIASTGGQEVDAASEVVMKDKIIDDKKIDDKKIDDKKIDDKKIDGKNSTNEPSFFHQSFCLPDYREPDMVRS